MKFVLLMAVSFSFCLSAFASGTGDSDELVEKGNVALKSLDYKTAVSNFTEAIRLNPKNAKAFHYRGLANNLLGEPGKALSDQTAAIAIDPKFINAFVARAKAHSALGKKTDALADLNEAVKIDPKSELAISERAQIYMATDKYTDAISDYEKIIAMNPNEVTALLNLAKILATYDDDKVRNGKKALEYANRVYKLTEKISGYYSAEAIAASYAELGKFEDAIKWQEKAIGDMPQDYKLMRKKAGERLELYKMKTPIRYKEMSSWAI